MQQVREKNTMVLLIGPFLFAPDTPVVRPCDTGAENPDPVLVHLDTGDESCASGGVVNRSIGDVREGILFRRVHGSLHL